MQWEIQRDTTAAYTGRWGRGDTASSPLCIFKDRAGIGQKEEVTRLREQNTSEGDVLQVRVDWGKSQGQHICLS